MDTQKFFEAIRNQDTNDLPNEDKKIADAFVATLRQISTEFHSDIIHLLENVRSGNDIAELAGILHSLEARQLTQVIAFVTTGEATEEFMKSLDINPSLQRAVDIAFAGHVSQIQNVEQALEQAKEYIENDTHDGDIPS